MRVHPAAAVRDQGCLPHPHIGRRCRKHAAHCSTSLPTGPCCVSRPPPADARCQAQITVHGPGQQATQQRTTPPPPRRTADTGAPGSPSRHAACHTDPSAARQCRAARARGRVGEGSGGARARRPRAGFLGARRVAWRLRGRGTLQVAIGCRGIKGGAHPSQSRPLLSSSSTTTTAAAVAEAIAQAEAKHTPHPPVSLTAPPPAPPRPHHHPWTSWRVGGC